MTTKQKYLATSEYGFGWGETPTHAIEVCIQNTKAVGDISVWTNVNNFGCLVSQSGERVDVDIVESIATIFHSSDSYADSYRRTADKCKNWLVAEGVDPDEY